MKDYKEVAESVFRKSDIIIEARQRRIKKIRMVSAAASGMCAAAIVGITVLRTNILSHPVEDPRDGNNSSMITYEYDITDPATEPATSMTQAVTEANSTEPAVTEETAAVTVQTTTKSSLPVRVVVPENKTNNSNSADETHIPADTNEEPETTEPQIQTTEAPVVPEPTVEQVDEPDDNNWELFLDHIIYRHGCNGEYETVYDRCDSVISKDYAQRKIRSTYVDDPETGKHHAYKLTLYDIVHVSRKVAVAVRFEDDDENYHVYMNNSYRPSDIEHMIDEMNLRGFLKVDGECTVEDQHYTDIDRAFLWYVFTSEAKLPNLDEEPSGNTIVEFGVNIPVFGKEECTVRITDEGYVTTDMVSAGATFFIGEDRVDEIVEHIKNKYTVG